MKYRVLLRKSESGYTAVCPGLPESAAQGATVAEALENIEPEIAGSVTEREGWFWRDARDGEELREVDAPVGQPMDAGRGGSAMRYDIKMIKRSEGYSVSCPMLPGCFSQGDTEEAALANIQIAIREFLIYLQEVLLLGQPSVEIIEIEDADGAPPDCAKTARSQPPASHKGPA